MRALAMLTVTVFLLAGCSGSPDEGDADDPSLAGVDPGTGSGVGAPANQTVPQPVWTSAKVEGDVNSVVTINPSQGAERASFTVPAGALNVWLNITFDVEGAGELDLGFMPPGCAVTDACRKDISTQDLAASLLVEGPKTGTWEFVVYAQQAAVGTWTLDVNSLLPAV